MKAAKKQPAKPLKRIAAPPRTPPKAAPRTPPKTPAKRAATVPIPGPRMAVALPPAPPYTQPPPDDQKGLYCLMAKGAAFSEIALLGAYTTEAKMLARLRELGGASMISVVRAKLDAAGNEFPMLMRDERYAN